MPRDADKHLLDIQGAALDIMEFTEGMSFDDYH